MSCQAGHYGDGGNRRAPKRRKSTVEVFTDEGGFDRALKRFGKMTADIVLAAKRRSRFRARPTRSARKRRGKALEKRRARFEEVPE